MIKVKRSTSFWSLSLSFSHDFYMFFFSFLPSFNPPHAVPVTCSYPRESTCLHYLFLAHTGKSWYSSHSLKSRVINIHREFARVLIFDPTKIIVLQILNIFKNTQSYCTKGFLKTDDKNRRQFLQTTVMWEKENI